MARYLVTYEYKESSGEFIITRTTTKVFTISELEDIQNKIGSWRNYIKILSCYTL